LATTTEDTVARLRDVPLFAGCPDASLRRLAEVTAEVTFPAGRLIVNQGQIGNGLYIVVSGSASVVHGSDVLLQLGPGEFFGELSVIDQQPRSASVVAATDTVCLALASWDLLALLEQDSRLALNLIQVLASRLRACGEQLRH
jgi:CRP-like cAMP-binding protein